MNNGFIAFIEEQKSKGKAFRADTAAQQCYQEFKFCFFFMILLLCCPQHMAFTLILQEDGFISRHHFVSGKKEREEDKEMAKSLRNMPSESIL